MSTTILQKIFELRRISLDSSKEVINKRMQIKNNISNLCDQLNDIMLIIKSATGFQQKLMELLLIIRILNLRR